MLTDYVLSVDSYTEQLRAGQCALVADRWHFGERTYAPTKRPHTNVDGYGLLGRSGWRWTELFLLSRGGSTFWINQPLKVLLSRAGRGDSYVGIHELNGILRAYEESMRLSPTYKLDITPPAECDDLTQYADEMIELSLSALADTQHLGPWPEYIGHPQPSALLVGDRRNVTKAYGNETRLPFMPVAGNSGSFLLDRLPDPFWREIGLVNGHEVGTRLEGLWAALGRPKILALGREAEAMLKKNGIQPDKYVTLPHPQYVKRFAYESADDYAAAIVRGATQGKVAQQWRT